MNPHFELVLVNQNRGSNLSRLQIKKVNTIDDNTHSFILRFWLEPRELENAKPIWRGVVEHVASGQRRYLQDLDDIKGFVASILQDKGPLLQKK